ncbi:MAG: aminotransferase class I/II-fold pyridoxal phosphate-dependent enzyme, partial [Candidatus Parcubacteria bacterium]|nr:aminotransferase class I/II-fold pyridoxal phosphate-dependent enzyme [Candidatus Parcubacteria bacterium]
MIKFLDLQKQYRSIKKEINTAIQGVLNSGHFILGPEVEEIERQIAKYCGVKYAIGVNSGTDALLLSLMALNIKRGDEVITTPFSFMATVDVIILCGARPVFVDINPKTFNIDSKKIEAAITGRTKVIMPVHLYGQPA